MWRYTPRQAAAFLFLGNLRKRRKASEQLILGNAAAHGTPKAVRKMAKEMEKV